MRKTFHFHFTYITLSLNRTNCKKKHNKKVFFSKIFNTSALRRFSNREAALKQKYIEKKTKSITNETHRNPKRAEALNINYSHSSSILFAIFFSLLLLFYL